MFQAWALGSVGFSVEVGVEAGPSSPRSPARSWPPPPTPSDHTIGRGGGAGDARRLTIHVHGRVLEYVHACSLHKQIKEVNEHM